MIVVMPLGRATPFGLPPAQGGVSKDVLFEEYVLKDVIPTVAQMPGGAGPAGPCCRRPFDG